MFGLKPSPAIFGSVMQHHLNKYSGEHPELVKQISDGLHVDDLVTGADSVDEAFQVYSKPWSTNSQQLSHMINLLQINLLAAIPRLYQRKSKPLPSLTPARSIKKKGEKCQKLLGITNLMIF